MTEDVIWDLKDIKSKDPDVKWEAVNNLSKYLEETQDFRSKMIIKSFLSMINDPMDNVRETVYSTLIRHLSDKPRLETILLKGTKDKSPGIRSLSLEWLNANNHSSIDSQTISALQDSSEAVRKIAIDIVVQRNIPGVEKRLLELLKQEKGG
ncbi:MAG: HEAT repeat domain-containing protein, partial [Candidatus Hodarchaeales archaeon]